MEIARFRFPIPKIELVKFLDINVVFLTIANVPMLHPRSPQEFGPAGLSWASSPMTATLLGAFKGRALLTFFKRTVEAPAISRARRL